MVYSITYRRPPHVDSKRGSVGSGKTGPSIGGTTLDDSQDVSINYGIPEALSFDRIIDGGTCPVCCLVYHHPVATAPKQDQTRFTLRLGLWSCFIKCHPCDSRGARIGTRS